MVDSTIVRVMVTVVVRRRMPVGKAGIVCAVGEVGRGVSGMGVWMRDGWVMEVWMKGGDDDDENVIILLVVCEREGEGTGKLMG